MLRATTFLLLLATASVVGNPELRAQTPGTPLSALLAEADTANPGVRKALRSAEAARARISPAGALADPTVGIGFMNVPVSNPGLGGDMMTMTRLQVGAVFPWPGKRTLREDAAARAAEAAAWDVQRVRNDVRAVIKAAYYEVYFVDRALAVTRRNHALLTDFARLTSTKYGVGTGAQPDVLKAQVEQTRLADQLVALRERRVVAAARLNQALARAPDFPVGAAALPERVSEAADRGRVAGPSFTSRTLSADADPDADPEGVLDVSELRRLAREHNPRLQAALRSIAAQERRLALAGKATLPDLSVTAGYSRRGGLSDFFNLMVSAPVPIFSRRKQDEEVREEGALLAGREAGYQAALDQVDQEIESLVAELRRARDQVVLLRDGILPQARTGLASATASYQVGGVDFLSLLDAQVTLYRHELDYHRLLADFATNIAALERAVGTEVLP